ncbi:MAG: hypothetical protein E6I26_11335, partial [Chloroflexi bacterium]
MNRSPGISTPSARFRPRPRTTVTKTRPPGARCSRPCTEIPRIAPARRASSGDKQTTRIRDERRPELEIVSPGPSDDSPAVSADARNLRAIPVGVQTRFRVHGASMLRGEEGSPPSDHLRFRENTTAFREPAMVDKMSEDEVWAFLRDGSRTATFASVRPDGRPHATPTWYAVDGDEIVFTTWHETVKAANIRAHPAVVVLVQ